jgi:hypothetical protein
MRMNIILILVLIPCLVFAQANQNTSLESSFSATQEMTPEQTQEAKNFVHQGMLQETIDNKCKDQIACDSAQIDQAGSVIGGTFGSAIEQNIGKLYSFLIGGMGMIGGQGGGAKVTVLDKDNEAFKAIKDGSSKDSLKDLKKKDGEKKNDYCVYAAMSYELIATYIHQSMQKKIQSDLSQDTTSGEQVKALTALKMEHENREKTSKYQAWVYATTSGCYIARAALSGGRVQMDPTYWAKMAAAGAISTLYFAKANKHKNAAEIVQNVINDIPRSGACNPYTQTPCFCAENSSKTAYPDLYQQICILKKDIAQVNQPQIPCGVLKDGKMMIDQNCKCKASNSCFKGLVKLPNPNVQFGANVMNETNKAFDLLNSGNLNSGELDNYAARMQAASRKIASKAKIPNVKLSPEQKKIADSLKGLNLPPAVAGMVAQAPQVNSPALNMSSVSTPAISKLPKSVQDKLKDIEGPKFKSGSASQNVAESEETFELPKMGDEAETPESVEVLNFAEAAVSKADVSNAPETPIFDIISNRYKRSGWTKLEASDEK